MARKLRINFPGACYHVINRGNNKEAIFKDRSDRLKFLQILAKYREKFNLTIYSYCLMTNHIHLFIKTNEANLSQAMKMINWSYAVYFNKKYCRSGHLFQSRFTSKTVRSGCYFLALVRYIHNNCVKAGLVTRPEFYEWCSHKDYLSGNKSMVNGMDEILGFFEGDKKEYISFIKSKVSEDEYEVLNRIRNEDLEYSLASIQGIECQKDIYASIGRLARLNSLDEYMINFIKEKIKS